MKPRDERIYIYGKHVLHEALTCGKGVLEKVFLRHSADTSGLRQLADAHKIPVLALTVQTLPRTIEPEVHQGAVGVVSIARLLKDYEDFMREVSITPDTLLVLLDELQDPQNVGAIVRSATAFGAAGVLIPERRQAPVSGAVIKASAGTAFSIPLVKIGNVNGIIRDLKDRGFWVYGLEAASTSDISKEEFEKPSVIVVGGEGRGIREKTRGYCDALLSISMSPRCESLNVSAAAAVALHAWSSAHPSARRER